ncbi:hypothetical protein FOXYSP1_09304 [Fusarium oxysporum f. sp. phaseoli]
MVLLDIFPRVNWPLLSRVWCVGRGRVVLRGTPIERKRKGSTSLLSFFLEAYLTRRHELARRVQGGFRVESRDLMERGIQEKEDQGSVHVFRSVSVYRGAVDIEFDYQRLGGIPPAALVGQFKRRKLEMLVSGTEID